MSKKRFHLKKLTLAVSLFWAGSSYAMVTYVAKPLDSRWILSKNTPLECSLVHHIPNYGEVLFSASASKRINLGLMVTPYRPNGSTENVSLISMPPQWMPGVGARRMDSIRFYKQFDGYVGGQTAWAVLQELAKGRYPTFTYRDWYNSNLPIQVSLSAANFKKTNLEFNQCISRLLPYSFEDIAFSVLHFNKNGRDLKTSSKKKLEKIAQYLKHSDDIDLEVVLSTYTDSSGPKLVNKRISEERAKNLEEYFTSQGVSKDKIKISPYGETRPIGNNESPMGRALNRRVVISMN